MARRAEAATRADKLEYLRLLEEKRRRRARDNLNEYCRQIEIPGVPLGTDVPDDRELPDDDADVPSSAWDVEEFYPTTVEPAAHHELINDVLDRVDRGEITRAMFFLPPGSAKSTYGTVTFPTRFMGRRPGRSVISVSYASNLATRFGRRCRQITRSPRYREIFGTELQPGDRAANRWSLTNGSTYLAGGILSGITGSRADLLNIDDPFKGPSEARSKTIRDKVWDEYKLSLRTRLKPGGRIVIIMTRWHKDDLAGRILPPDWNGESGWVTAQDGERWYVVCLPAQCERDDDPLGRQVGEYLWTDWKPVEEWEQEKKSQGPRNWLALYQQRPTPEGGGIFEERWWRYWSWDGSIPGTKALPRTFDKFVTYWDTTFDGGASSDFNAGVVIARAAAEFFVLDRDRARMRFTEAKKAIPRLAARWPECRRTLVEDKANGPALVDELRTVLPGLILDPVNKTTGSKVQRAEAIADYVEAGNVYLPHPTIAAWVRDEWLPEFNEFPDGLNDDQVDAFTGGMRDLTRKRGRQSAHPVVTPERYKPPVPEVLQRDAKVEAFNRKAAKAARREILARARRERLQGPQPTRFSTERGNEGGNGQPP